MTSVALSPSLAQVNAALPTLPAFAFPSRYDDSETIVSHDEPTIIVPRINHAQLPSEAFEIVLERIQQAAGSLGDRFRRAAKVTHHDHSYPLLRDTNIAGCASTSTRWIFKTQLPRSPQRSRWTLLRPRPGPWGDTVWRGDSHPRGRSGFREPDPRLCVHHQRRILPALSLPSRLMDRAGKDLSSRDVGGPPTSASGGGSRVLWPFGSLLRRVN